MNEQKVFGFIDKIDSDRREKIQDTELQNSMEYKYKCLQNAKDDCRKQCLSKIFEKFYLNAIPLNDEYKNACSEEIKSDIPAFVKHRGHEDLVYYVGEALKRCGREGNPAKSIMEAVDAIVDGAFRDKEMNLKDYQSSDLVFKMDDEIVKKIDVASQDLGLDDLSKVIADNVQSTAEAEIIRAKKEKEEARALEAQLANNLNITSEAAIENELALRGLTDKKIFQPSLFEGIMIGKLEKTSLMAESGSSTYLYNALSEYGINSDGSFASPEEVAYVESVREYTLLNISKALKLENFTLNMLREMAQDYAMNN